MASNLYDTFTDSLDQLERDQTFFENEISHGELKGNDNHETLVKYGGKMCGVLKKFADKGPNFACNKNDLLVIFVAAIKEYTLLLMPKKVCGGMFSCCKASRSGAAYDLKYYSARSKCIAAILGSKSALLYEDGDNYNTESMNYTNYARKANDIQGILSAIKSNKIGDAAKDKSRKELIAAVDKVKQFLRSFEDQSSSIYDDAQRRVTSCSELLTISNKKSLKGKASKSGAEDGGADASDGSSLISNRTLVKVQASLQEVMNSAVSISLGKAKQSINDLKRLNDILNEENKKAELGLQKIKPQLDPKYYDTISSQCKDWYNQTSTLLKEASKRWEKVKAESSPRPVIEYIDESSFSGAVTSAAVDPAKVLQNAGQKMKAMGEKVVNNPTSVPGDALDAIGGVMNNFAANAVNLASTFTNTVTPTKAPVATSAPKKKVVKKG